MVSMRMDRPGSSKQNQKQGRCTTVMAVTWSQCPGKGTEPGIVQREKLMIPKPDTCILPTCGEEKNLKLPNFSKLYPTVASFSSWVIFFEYLFYPPLRKEERRGNEGRKKGEKWREERESLFKKYITKIIKAVLPWTVSLLR